ncbi:MAG: hypothetical protein ACRDOK_10135 [Streptosporangiaceae bacterium]
MELVLDAPVTADVDRDRPGPGPLRGDAGDAESGDRRAGGAVEAGDVPLDQEGLPGVGEQAGRGGSTWMVRVSARPWARPVIVCWTGTSRHGSASRASNRPGWLSLTAVKI